MANLEKGRDFYSKGKYEEAEPYLQKAVERFSNYADLRNMLGIIAHDKNDLDTARSNFEKALEINPRYTEAALNLAVTYNEQGQYSKAKQIHDRVSSLTNGTYNIEPFALGKITNMHAELGQAYAEVRLFDKAIEQYRAALNLNPEYVDIRTRFGKLLRDQGDIKEAIIQFKRVLETRSDYVPALISLGTSYYALGDKKNAEAQWARAVELDPENRSAGMYLRMIRQLHALEEAEESGVHLEVEKPAADADTGKDNGEISFIYDGKSKQEEKK